jgi:hydrogenase-4 component F
MSALALVVLPVVVALVLSATRARARAMPALTAAAVACTALAALQLARPFDEAVVLGLVRLDDTGRLFLVVVNAIFLGVSAYAWNRVHVVPALVDEAARFAALALAFLAATNVVLMANHLLLQWIALEATTLAAAPMIVRPDIAASRQASWRYLLFSSVALGLVLLGFACLGRGLEGGAHEVSWYLGRLPPVEGAWGKLGLSLVLLGLGTKLGLAPMYSWLPEAYDEAPPAVTALLGAVQFNAALVMLLRVVQAWRPANASLMTGQLLAMGAASMLVSTASLIATRNMKRLLAYASINHAGVIAIGLGIGKGAAYGVLLYVLSNAFIKAILFLTAGKIKAHYRTKDTRRIQGLIKDLPYSGVFLMVGTFALLGFPPFGSFFGELLILSALVGSGQLLVFAAFCVLVTMSFVATGRTIFPMIWGESKVPVTWPRQTLGTVAPKLFFLVALVALGVYVPPAVEGLLKSVAATLEGS